MRLRRSGTDLLQNKGMPMPRIIWKNSLNRGGNFGEIPQGCWVELHINLVVKPVENRRLSEKILELEQNFMVVRVFQNADGHIVFNNLQWGSDTENNLMVNDQAQDLEAVTWFDPLLSLKDPDQIIEQLTLIWSSFDLIWHSPLNGMRATSFDGGDAYSGPSRLNAASFTPHFAAVCFRHASTQRTTA